ncbi:hypothetical protein [Thalassococcus lentus]|uniref:Uncharacterized protein n=1 Tax=Thalassococcus lentus TaxID=1210524 RepID=A0ABT4XW56_9RHOB|nr:hypothetical protein [Thalassococcus lentus]MDA7426043.1 hypothetical protein [Thalassococcus lentus]
MQIPSLPQIAAPLTTGHPLGLPEAAQQKAQSSQVPSVQPSDGSASDPWRDHPSQHNAQQGDRDTEGQPKTAPPSIMQIKISQLLDAQAEEQPGQTQDHASAIIPEPTDPASQS